MRPALPLPAVAVPDATSLYVHVPFCVVKCGYCDFTSYVVEDTSVHDAFLRALDAELKSTTVPRSPSTVFVGGGTPSHLSTDRLNTLFEILARHVDLRGCVEVSMESNPESINEEKVEIALRHGVTRFSMGVQSFDPERLRFLDRAHSGPRAREAFAELKRAGADNVSLDLIFGLPGQTVAQWEADLAIALELRPDHLSCYSLTFEPGTRLHRDLRQGRVVPVEEEADRAMFLRTREVLAEAGYRAYEISNFAGRGGPCRHNDHYWLQGDYVGVGPGASSHRRGVRHTNQKPIDAWVRAALDGLPPVATAETLTPMQRLGEALWLGIRRVDGIDIAAIEARIGLAVEPMMAKVFAIHLANGWIERDGTRLRLTPAGLLVADVVGSDYLVLPDSSH
ncbi:MAG: radical SAM family heme chaperone HemW [Planctomycetota bacterium]